jgi:hypothetical protein
MMMMAVRVSVSILVIRIRERRIPFQIIALIIAVVTMAKHERFLEQRVSLKRVELEFNVYVWRVIM